MAQNRREKYERWEQRTERRMRQRARGSGGRKIPCLLMVWVTARQDSADTRPLGDPIPCVHTTALS